jgi:hypothetical protein
VDIPFNAPAVFNIWLQYWHSIYIEFISLYIVS